MNPKSSLPEEQLEEMLTRRATRAGATDLLEVVMDSIDKTPQRRGILGRLLPARSALPGPAATFGAIVILAALVIGGTLLGSRSTGPGANGSSAPGAADASPTRGLKIVSCEPRAMSAAARPINLNGSWQGGGSLIYLRQEGTTLWGVAIFDPFGADLHPELIDVGPYLILHGTIATDGSTHLDWASAGDRFPGEHRFKQFQDAAGSIVFALDQGDGGVARLTAGSETGSAWSGGAYSTLTLTSCTPAVH